MTSTEKRTNEVKIRLEDSLLLEVSQLAHVEDRTLADYLHHIISAHARGHGYKLRRGCDCGNQSIRD